MKKLCIAGTIALVALALPATAAQVAELNLNAASADWHSVGSDDAVLTVTGPNGFYLEQKVKAGSSASMSLFDADGYTLADGQYRWNLVATRTLSRQDRAALADRRGEIDLAPVTDSGYFRIAGGAFVTAAQEQESAGGDGPQLSTRDQVIADDLIVDGSICTGFDCVNGENFGADTLRLKENNLRIHFDDTSNSGSFPSNDWRIVANDQTNGGASYLAIEDSTAGRTPFRVEAGAPNHSLYVDDAGNVGLNTNAPVVELHIIDGDTPTIRLQQDGSSGFTAQTWDLAGNETNFFVRDVTNGSQLPFKIRPSAPTGSLVIATDGSVGLGLGNSTSPAAKFHIENTGSQDTDDFVVAADGKVGIGTTAPSESIHIVTAAQNSGRIRFNDGNQWDMGSGSGDTFIINDNNGDAAEMTVFANGNVTITGTLTTGGPVCNAGAGGCDTVFSTEYEVESIEQHADYMWANSHLPAVGPTSEEGPFNLSTMTGGMLNELEKAHIYIAQLHERLAKLEAQLESNGE